MPIRATVRDSRGRARHGCLSGLRVRLGGQPLYPRSLRLRAFWLIPPAIVVLTPRDLTRICLSLKPHLQRASLGSTASCDFIGRGLFLNWKPFASLAY
jgi:hypothetical protein